MQNKELAINWLRRAKSNLLRAGLEIENEEILLEDLVFDCQQCVEKSLKAICIINDLEFPFTHNIALLFEVIEENNIKIPDNSEEAMILTDYAVQTRYPGNYDPVSKEEYEEAIKIAKEIFDWAKEYIDNISQNREEI